MNAAPASPCRRAVALVLLTVLAYLPVFRAGFIWDDDTTITANAITQPGGLYRTWFTTAQPNYWPLTWSGLWLQWQAWGAAPLGYHVVSLLLHLLCALALWRLLLRLRVPGAWLAALGFAVHPVNAETVAWVTQQKTLLSTLFGAVAFLAYVRHDDTGSRRDYAAALAAFVASLLSKSATVSLPVVLLLAAWWRRGRLARQDWRRTAPFFLLSAAAGLTEIWFQYHRARAADIRTDPLSERALTAANAAWHYLRTVVWPADLCFVTPTPDLGLGNPRAWLVPAAVAIAIVVAWRARRSWGRHALFAMAAYGALLLPILGLLNIYFMRYSWVADHWQYPAIIVPLAGLAALAMSVARRLPARTAALTAAAGLAWLAALTAVQAHVHADAERLWRHTLARNPNAWLAHGNLGALLVVGGRHAEAADHLRRAIALTPDDPIPRLMLAVCLSRLGDLAGAHGQLDAVLAREPRHAQAWYERGRLQAQAGDFAAARESYQRAAEAPAYAAPHLALALLARNAGDAVAAGSAVQRALALAPNDPDALHLRGDLAFDAGRYADARRDYETVRARRPAYPRIDNDIGVAAARAGDTRAAAESFRRAVDADPADADARNNLARALRALERAP